MTAEAKAITAARKRIIEEVKELKDYIDDFFFELYRYQITNLSTLKDMTLGFVEGSRKVRLSLDHRLLGFIEDEKVKLNQKEKSLYEKSSF